MPVTDITTDPESLTMTLVVDASASVDRLWKAFTDPAQLSRFWGPPGWPSTFTAFDLRPGGRADYYMTSPRGERSGGAWEVLNVDEGRSFEVLDSFVGDGTVEEEVVLHDNAEMVPVVSQSNSCEILAVNENLAAHGMVEGHDQGNQGALARTARTYERRRCTRGGLE